MPRMSIAELLYIRGLVQTLSDRGLEVMLLARKDHVDTARCLFDDVPGVRFTFVASWGALHTADDPPDAADGVLARLEGMRYACVPLPSYRNVCPYAVLGLPAALARSDFGVRRDHAAERQLLDRVKEATQGKAYMVVHDEPRRRIRRDLVPDGLVVVRTDDARFKARTVFDWIQVIDHAIHLHAVDSCFLMLADLLSLRPRKFLHAYADKRITVSPVVYADVITVWS